jgi:hypothetical protein
MAIEPSRDYVPADPNLTKELKSDEFITPREFIGLTLRNIESVKLIQIPEKNINHGYKSDLLRLPDKTVIEEGLPSKVPQFEVHLGSYLNSEQRALELLKIINSIKINNQAENSRSLYSLQEVEDMQKLGAYKAKVFYEENRELVDNFIQRMTSGSSDVV